MAAIWGIGGSCKLNVRTDFCNKIHEICTIDLPNPNGPPIIDYEVRVEDQSWHLWKARVPTIDIEPSKVCEAELVITTIDTLRH